MVEWGSYGGSLIYTTGRHVSAAGSKVTVWLQLEERQLSESKSFISEVQLSFTQQAKHFTAVFVVSAGGAVRDRRHGHYHVHQDDHAGHPEPVQLRGGGEPVRPEGSPGSLQGSGWTQ